MPPTGPSVYEETRFEAILEDETEKRRRFQSAFKVPNQRRLLQSSVTKPDSDPEHSGPWQLESNDDPELSGEADVEDDDESIDPRFNVLPRQWH